MLFVYSLCVFKINNYGQFEFKILQKHENNSIRLVSV